MATCSNGHVNPDSSRFCLTCGLMMGAPIPTGEPTNPNPNPMNPNPIAASPNQGWASPLETPPSESSRPAWLIPVIAVGAVIVLVIAALGITQLSGGSTTNLDVTLTVFNDEGCDLGLGYFDVPGSTVIVSVDGVPTAFGDLPTFGDDGFLYCEFTTTIADVPTDGEIYQIEIGRRGEQTLTRMELESANWSYEASLGL